MPNESQVTMWRAEERIHFVQEGWDLKPHGRLSWLHRLLWRMLERLNALKPAMNQKVDLVRFPISNDEIFHRILESREDLFDNHRKPTRVLIGPRTLGDLMGCEEMRSWNSPIQFNAKAGFSRTIYDLPIEVVPQMEGVVVLCDDAKRV